MSYLVAIDFETKGIEEIPDYPPEPVGLSIYRDGEAPFYMSFGHASNNCSDWDTARAILEGIWNDPDAEVIAQNSPFDTYVALKHFNLPMKPKGVMHDTLVMAFLLDPHAYTYALKPSAERYLGQPPEEQDFLKDWLYRHGIIRINQKDWGSYIWMIPGDIVAPYANGDTQRTLDLFKVYRQRIEDLGMWKAYRREMDLQPIMLQNTIDGICVDEKRLNEDIAIYDEALAEVDNLLFEELGCEPFNLDSGPQLADAIDRAHPGLKWELTPKGKRSTSKANMEKTLEGLTGKLLALMQYRASLDTCVNTFMRVWRDQAKKAGDGRIRCQWFTTRSDDGGARTGRLSSSPNFQNIPTLESNKFKRAIALYNQWLSHLPPLPNVRSYIIADAPGHVLCGRDFSSQELRVLAHYEDGPMLQAYKDNPRQDLHEFAKNMIAELIGLMLTRKHTKTISFACIYGSGLETLASQMGCDVPMASRSRDAYFVVFPGIKELNKELKARAKRGEPIRTWGGRVYYVEPPRMVEGRWRTFDYKLLNILCQGGSADITKDAVIAYNKRKVHGRLLLTVHDEIVLSVPEEHKHTENAILKDCMESIPLDAPLITDGEFGFNWHELMSDEEVEA